MFALLHHAVLILAASFAIHQAPVTPAPVPLCPEDSIVVGVGSFDAGYWSRYVCGPSWDDFPGSRAAIEAIRRAAPTG